MRRRRKNPREQEEGGRFESGSGAGGERARAVRAPPQSRRPGGSQEAAPRAEAPQPGRRSPDVIACSRFPIRLPSRGRRRGEENSPGIPLTREGGFLALNWNRSSIPSWAPAQRVPAARRRDVVGVAWEPSHRPRFYAPQHTLSQECLLSLWRKPRY